MTKQEIIKKCRKNKNWYHKGFSGYFFCLHEQGSAIASAARKKIKFALPYGILFVNRSRPDYLDWFWDENDNKKGRKEIIAAVKKNITIAKKIFDNFLTAYKNYKNYFESLPPDTRDLGLTDIKIHLSKLHELMTAEGEIGYIADNFLTSEKEDWFLSILNEELGEKLNQEIIAKFTAPVFASFVSQYEKGLNNLGIMIANKAASAKIKKTAAALEREFFWIRTSYHDYKRLTSNDILTEARLLVKNKELKPQSDITEKAFSNQKAKDLLCRDLGISKETKNIIYLSSLIAHIQDKRKECVLRHNMVCLSMIEKMADIFHVKKEILFQATYDEIMEIIEKGGIEDLTVLQSRLRHGLSVLYYNGGIQLFGKMLFDKFSVDYFFQSPDLTQEIKGTTAYKGLVRGRVRVLFRAVDAKDFKAGEILVTNQTTPEFVPAMKKAGAVITDQGGITCHAAIVARELKIPCIVGTKVATKVLKDGDYVEVDADRGVVRLLKKKEK